MDQVWVVPGVPHIATREPGHLSGRSNARTKLGMGYMTFGEYGSGD